MSLVSLIKQKIAVFHANRAGDMSMKFRGKLLAPGVAGLCLLARRLFSRTPLLSLSAPHFGFLMRGHAKRIFLAIVPAVLLCLSASAATFEAYYTRLDPSPRGAAGKYADLVVVLGQTNRIEFTRANGYLPQWRTAGGRHRVENLFPDGDADPNGYYTYVRLLENGPDRVVVHWRHFKDIATLIEANADLDALNPHGITGVVHELFTIYPDGKVEREVREAANTRYQDWVDPRLATRQSLKPCLSGCHTSPRARTLPLYLEDGPSVPTG